MIIKFRAKNDSQNVEVKDLSEASNVFRGWIEANGYGASDLYKGAGDVLESKKVIAQISYNGRAWDPSGKEIK